MKILIAIFAGLVDLEVGLVYNYNANMYFIFSVLVRYWIKDGMGLELYSIFSIALFVNKEWELLSYLLLDKKYQSLKY